MTITSQTYVGIDASKDTLEVARLGKKPTEQFANTKPGMVKLVRYLKQVKPKLIVVEATGGYGEAMVLALFEAGLPVALVSPQRVRQYAKAKGLLAKTDQIDAHLLADFGKNIQPRLFVAKTEERKRLSALVGRRNQLKELEAKIQAFMKEYEDFSEQEKLLRTAKSIGAVTAATLLADLPELGQLDRKQTVAARRVGRFLPFAIYSHMDSPQECQSNEKYHETKLFSCQRDHQGLHIRHEYPHPPSARLALNRSGKDDFKFSLAANSAINLFCHEDGKFNNHPASEVVIKWNFRAAMPPLPWLKKH